MVIAVPSYDPKIVDAFDNQTWIRVVVVIRDTSNITLTGTTEERRNLLIEKDAWFSREIDDLFKEFQDTQIRDLRKRSGGFGADITKEEFYFLIFPFVFAFHRTPCIGYSYPENP